MALSMLQFIRKLSALRCIGESYGFSEIRESWNLLNEGCGGEERRINLWRVGLLKISQIYNKLSVIIKRQDVSAYSYHYEYMQRISRMYNKLSVIIRRQDVSANSYFYEYM